MAKRCGLGTISGAGTPVQVGEVVVSAEVYVPLAFQLAGFAYWVL